MTESQTPIAKKLLENEEHMTPVTVTTHEVTYIANNNDGISASQVYVSVDEEVEVEEKYCGPITCVIGTILFFVFWPATAFMGCCLCDKRNVKKKRVK